MLGGFTFQAPLLGLFTEHDTVRSRKVGGAQMQKNREVGGCGGWVGGGGRGGVSQGRTARFASLNL